MRFFRRGRRRRGMAEKESADRDWPEELNSDETPSKIRVNDRRRFNTDGEVSARGEGEANEEPRLKPTYVEELEARTRAAEQKAADLQSRFEQLRAELKRETDELRQRLARTADERVARERADFISSLLPVVDNLSRAVEAAEGAGSQKSLLAG